MRAFRLLLIAVFAGCGPTRLAFQHEPRFTSFASSVPAARSGYPGGEWGLPAPDLVSGFDYMFVFTPETARPSHVVVQRVVITGHRFDSVQACGDTHIPFGFPPRLEYFRSPALDLQAWLGARPERSYTETRRGMVAYLELPGSPPAIAAGEQAAELDQTYLDSLPDAERARLGAGPLDDASFTRWQHLYEYDGCHGATNAATACGQVHCLTVSWHEVTEGRRGSEQQETFSGPGGGP